jgi:glycosyltransferase involved in cell wall biosynthesis
VVAQILIIAYTNYYQDPRVKRHAEALAERGDTVDVISLGYGPRDHNTHGLHSLFALPMGRYRGDNSRSYLGSYWQFFRMASKLARQLSRERRYSLVIVCTMPDAAVVTALGPRWRGAKILLDIHDTMPELYQEKWRGLRGALGSRLLRIEELASTWLAHRVLAVHEPHRERLVRAGVREDKIHVVANSPDPRIFTPRTALPHNDRFNLVCHGTVTRRLGLDLVIEALQTADSRIDLTVIGEGDYLPAVKELTERLNLNRRVAFLPTMNVERLPAVLSQMDAGIVPNRESAATHLMLPSKLLEYATLGVPIITTRLRAVEHYFPDDSVYYVEPGNVPALVDAINAMAGHPEMRADLGRGAAEVMSGLSWPAQRSELFATVDSLLLMSRVPDELWYGTDA